MSTSKTLAVVQRTKQFQRILASGLRLVSTERQLANGTLAFTGRVRVGKKTVQPTYAVTASGAVLSNEFVARRVEAESTVDSYRAGLEAVLDLLTKRTSKLQSA